MYKDNKVLIGKNGEIEQYILPSKANRHGLITGASGSGKTITLKVMAESFSSMGVPVFLADVKGDIGGTCMPGENSEKVAQRLEGLGITDFEFKGFPTVFWDVYGADGHPIRTTVESVGPTILSRMLGLSDVQEGVIAIAFKIARDKNLELIDLDDLRLLLQYIGDNSKEYTLSYGNITPQSVGAIQRNILMLEEQGGNNFFGEPAIDINDFVTTDLQTGYGSVNILHAVELFKQPNLYACFMLWILNALNQNMPEVGDVEKPRLVFFFDEAHLLFDDMPSYMLTQVVQIVKLIRSKGIGLYFVSQSPSDIPNEILAQLGNVVQHTLRAYTPAEQRAVKVIADSFRPNPNMDTEQTILGLGTGEAVVSFVNEKGEPGIAEKVTILPPQSLMGAIDPSIRLSVMNRSQYRGKYDNKINRESAYEKIQAVMQEKEEVRQQEEAQKAEEKAAKEKEKEEQAKAKSSKKEKSAVEKVVEKTANSALSTIGRKLGTSIVNGIFGKRK